ncbi:MAG: DUF1553 domain-containing protein, partial [Verrucomicrobiales bacterium]|nr:DUF1553 domain-containing protein [Verrucomicrobiales bacterium]
ETRAAEEAPSAGRARNTWEDAYKARLEWWSLRPLVPPPVPVVDAEKIARRGDIDAFVVASLKAKGLRPAPEADRRILARRLSFALTGLPPDPEDVERFVRDASPGAYEARVRALLDSPHFGERWARHWLDVVHYADTHGYEWDTPAKQAWMYRDYVIRAFNADVPIRRFFMEQIAGDLLDPRVDAETGLNASVLGTMALRLGERRHGDNAAAEGVTQEAIANIIDTVGKGFLATTVACAQCHDHKLDAVEQKDFYAMAGVFMSTRWHPRAADAADPNREIVERLRGIKREIRSELARGWRMDKEGILERFRALPDPPTNAPPPGFPESLRALRHRIRQAPPTREEFLRERDLRRAENATNLVVLADFSRDDGAPGWRWDGWGMQYGKVVDGEPVVAEEGDAVLRHLLPAGRWSHVWSTRLAGAVRSPFLETVPAVPLSAEMVGGRFAAEAFVVDHAFHSERMKFLDHAWPTWRAMKAGDFDTLEGGLDRGQRRVYLEWATKSLNNYFPPRTGYGGVKETDLDDPSSWFGVSRVVRHAAGKPPRDELGRFVALFATEAPDNSTDAWDKRVVDAILAAVERWADGRSDADDVRLLNDALETGLLGHRVVADSDLGRAVATYRETAKSLFPDRTIGAMTDADEGRDERIGVRGSYTTFGAVVPRGGIRFLGGASPRENEASSGRLELARGIADDRNPLTARVFVNRVWLYLFGEGLVRTPDDFGHLGEKPSHPELLDHLAAGFVADGWSLKRLIARIVTSTTWRQDSRPDPAALEVDPENRLWHHMPMRRLDAEAIRDAMLAVSGRLDPTLYGPPVDPPRANQDAAKRLFSGPLDGNGRRSLYLKMTLMEPPRLLALFNQPIPKLTVGRRDVTGVPDQALALLNDPFVVAMSRHWGERLVREGPAPIEVRVRAMARSALGRPLTDAETSRWADLVREMAERRGVPGDRLADDPGVWKDVAHAVFNLKEFIHVR